MIIVHLVGANSQQPVSAFIRICESYGAKLLTPRKHILSKQPGVKIILKHYFLQIRAFRKSPVTYVSGSTADLDLPDVLSRQKSLVLNDPVSDFIYVFIHVSSVSSIISLRKLSARSPTFRTPEYFS